MAKIKVLASGSKGNCYLLETEKETLILECGIHQKQIMKGLDYDISKVAGCLVTHEHRDHSKSIKDLSSKGINIYASKGTFDSLPKGDKECSHRFNEIYAKKPFVVGKFKILPFDVQHDVAEPLGFLIQNEELGRILFITDSYYCKYKFDNLDYILIECNFDKDILNDNEDMNVRKRRLYTSHFELHNVINFLNECNLQGVKNIILIHISGDNGSGEYFKDEIEKATGIPTLVAKKGLEVDLEF